MKYMTADELRAAFVEFFQARQHTVVPSSSLIPTHPGAPLFNNAGMNQFLPYFAGEETPPYPRAVSVQKCVRVRGKHDDIEMIGRTTRHLTFFEMLGNFSFGDYFKKEAIAYAWEFLTGVLALPADRLWVTVHESDDEGAAIWHDDIGLPLERIQRLGEDNFWEMGATGPCGPSSEIFYDKGDEHGAGGGPRDGGEERYVEIWNLVFMTNNRLESGELEPLPARNIDTGAGLDRILPILQGVDSVFESDLIRGLIGRVEELTGARYGADAEIDVSLRIVADHARAVTFLIADGVVPSNEDRGYVLRRIIRRAARHAQRAGAKKAILPAMAAAVTKAMHAGYPELESHLAAVQSTLQREEEKFLTTLSLGLGILEDVVSHGDTTISGEIAFKMHDTFGFPIELTAEVAAERGIALDREGFERVMGQQRARARAAEKKLGDDPQVRLRPVLDKVGQTTFLGYETTAARGKVLAVVDGSQGDRIEVFADRTPFYAEGGGQIGDTGIIETETGRGRVIDTTAPLPGITRHVVEVERGTLSAGQEAQLEVDQVRRAAIRRAHTATHILQWALRTLLGPQLHQQGSLVGPDYLRFDFNHHAPLTDAELQRVEELVMEQVLAGSPVHVTEMTRTEAQAAGALSFFGDKYGDVVRVVRAGDESTEFCGGTHVDALNQIGGFLVRTESSIGSNLRRIEAITGRAMFDAVREQRETLHAAAEALRVPMDQVPAALAKLQTMQRETDRERRRLSEKLDRFVAAELASTATDGVVVARCDGRDPAALRALASAVRDDARVHRVGLVGSPSGESLAIAVAVDDEQIDASVVARAAAEVAGGGGGGKDKRLAVAGGKDVARADAVLTQLRTALSLTTSV